MASPEGDASTAPGGSPVEDAAAAARLSPADRDAAVEAGVLAGARARAEQGDGDRDELASERGETARVGEDTQDRTARAVEAVSRMYSGADNPVLVDWSRFGVVIPVLAASPGSGASTTATVLADALQVARRSVLMVDTADPARSGLVRATRVDGPQTSTPAPEVRIRHSWRAQAIVARAETPLPVLAPGMLPPPPLWLPGNRAIDATVVDIGHDPWRVAAHPLTGAGAWLRTGFPSPQPILVLRPTLPALTHSEQILARLEPWIRLGVATRSVQLVVVGATRWPRGVAGAAGRRTHPLLADALFLPHDPGLARTGITAEVTPGRLRAASLTLLRRWSLVPDHQPSPYRIPRLWRRGRGRGEGHARPHSTRRDVTTGTSAG